MWAALSRPTTLELAGQPRSSSMINQAALASPHILDLNWKDHFHMVADLGLKMSHCLAPHSPIPLITQWGLEINLTLNDRHHWLILPVGDTGASLLDEVTSVLKRFG
ncbi:hypothetical protein EYZ11_000418 [Aspergillus tanneri]|uniref:Uncharacterized protein n=1 Tax=Aspergillus tanneri TaxID=1220188 RepID=A0A4S3JX57_9EURO|nr:hypothetical protein EYZ11_000418 [Aspergillus tanneri]